MLAAWFSIIPAPILLNKDHRDQSLFDSINQNLTVLSLILSPSPLRSLMSEWKWNKWHDGWRLQRLVCSSVEPTLSCYLPSSPLFAKQVSATCGQTNNQDIWELGRLDLLWSCLEFYVALPLLNDLLSQSTVPSWTEPAEHNRFSHTNTLFLIDWLSNLSISTMGSDDDSLLK